MEWIIALVTLTFLEIVLGIDNIIFVSIITNKLQILRSKGAEFLDCLLLLFFV